MEVRSDKCPRFAVEYRWPQWDRRLYNVHLFVNDFNRGEFMIAQLVKEDKWRHAQWRIRDLTNDRTQVIWRARPES